MNTVKELHIALDNQLQAINTNSKRGILPEEKDLVLNSAVNMFLNNRVADKENQLKRVQDLQGLKTPAPIILPVFINSDDSVYANLPVDYLSIISSYSILENSCKPNTHKTASTSKQVFYIRLVDDIAPSDVYKNFNIYLNNTPIYTKNYYLSSNSAKFMMVNDILSTINMQRQFTSQGNMYQLSCYYEYYDIMYIPNAIILVVDYTDASNYMFSCTYTGMQLPVINNSHTQLYYQYDFTNTIKSYNELQSSFNDEEILSTVYGSRNRYRKPLSTIAVNRLIVSHSNTFTIKEIGIEYYRKPVRINYAKNHIPNLPFEEIIPLAVQLLKSYIGDPSYEVTKDVNQILE